MAYDILLLSVGCIVVAISIYALTFLRKKSAVGNDEQDVQRPRGIPRERGPAGDVAPRRAGRNIRARMRAAANRQEDDEEEDEEDTLADEIAMPDGKIGAKKRKKLEAKAEKKIMRERELEEREERKQRQQELEEKKRKEEEKERQEELKKEAEEKALKEEQEQKELEEYLKLKATFDVEEEGFDENNEAEEGHLFQDFVNYIQEQKVVLLEDLAAKFKLKTQDAIDRVQDLLAQEILMGVIDDRGKFISITREELEAVAQFIRQRGRVSISDLAESSNMLINLQPEAVITS